MAARAAGKLKRDMDNAPTPCLNPRTPTNNFLQTIMSIFSLSIFACNKSNRPIISVQTCGLSFDSLVDTGADISIISEKLFRQIPIDRRPQKLPHSPLSLSTACGGTLQCRGRYLFPLVVQGRTCLQPVFVVSNLNTPALLGIDFIHEHGLLYDGKSRQIKFSHDHKVAAISKWEGGILRLAKEVHCAALSATIVNTYGVTADQNLVPQQPLALATAHCVDQPLITGGPALVQFDAEGRTKMRLFNANAHDITLPRGHPVAIIENLSSPSINRIEYVDPRSIQAMVEHTNRPTSSSPAPSENDKHFIRQNMNINVPAEYYQRYENLLLKYHDVFSRSKQDLGRSDALQHEIHLKTRDPVYVKQFKIPDTHREVIEKSVKEWLALGIVEPARSRYNSPMFCVGKKDGSLRLVQDFRSLNAASQDDKYTMKDVTECIGEIGRAGSSIFSTLDLTSGFWQMVLQKESRPYTAFTVPGLGQFQWKTSPMGLLGCPASFQRLVELVMHKINNLIIYIDDLLIHTDNHDLHLETLEKVFVRLRQHNLKVNLKKCVFGDQNVAYLGFRLTPQGIKPGSDKLKAVKDCPPPTTVKQVRAFLGLCNFFRGHVKNFAIISSALTKLTCQDSTWKRGPLPQPALQAFQELKSILTSEPVMGYPRRDRPYSLIVDAATGTPDQPGGIGAILAQTDKAGKQIAIAYASRKLQQFEKNYSPFLLEMQAAVWAMEHFHTHLLGRRFTLFTDHKPLEKLNTVHTKTLNRLQLKANEFTFDIKYKKGAEMPADFLSRNVVNAITVDPVDNIHQQYPALKMSYEQLSEAQLQHAPFRDLRQLILHQILPPLNHDDNIPQIMQYRQQLIALGKECFIERKVIWRRALVGGRETIQLLVPPPLRPQILAESHGSLISGHDGVNKTLARIQQSYYWPYMAQNVENHIKSCVKCLRRKPSTETPALTSTLPQCSSPNQRIHIDLFGPLKNSENNNNYIMCMTDAFTKYIILAPIPNKEAITVAKVFFDKYICQFSVPVMVVSDQGKEFCNKLFTELSNLLQFRHKRTTAYHPQCNSQVEIANKTIAKYLASFVDNNTLNWEDYIFPLMLSYNTSVHSATKTSPFELTFAMEPRIPPFENNQRHLYGDSFPMNSLNNLQFLRQKAMENNLFYKDSYLRYTNQQKEIPQFRPGQKVWMKTVCPPGVNSKLYPKYCGPLTITKQLSPLNFELITVNNRKIIVHADRLKSDVTMTPGRNLDSKILNPHLNQQDDPNLPAQNGTFNSESHATFPRTTSQAPSPHNMTSPHTTNASPPIAIQDMTSTHDLNPTRPIRRSERIANRQNVRPGIFCVQKETKHSHQKSDVKNIIIPRNLKALNPRNSVRVDKDNLIERLQRPGNGQQEEQREEVKVLTPASFTVQPLWNRPRTERKQNRGEQRRRIVFSPHTIPAQGAAAFRQHQIQQRQRQQQQQQVQQQQPQPPPQLEARAAQERLRTEQQRWANQSQALLTEERRRANQAIEKQRDQAEAREQRLVQEIKQLRIRLDAQEGETVDATHQLALVEQQLLQQKHQLSLADAKLVTEQEKNNWLEQQLTNLQTQPGPVSTIEEFPTEIEQEIIIDGSEDQSETLLPSAPTDSETSTVAIDGTAAAKLYPQLPFEIQSIRNRKTVTWSDQKPLHRRARSESPTRGKEFLRKLLRRSRRSLSPSVVKPISVLKRKHVGTGVDPAAALPSHGSTIQEKKPQKKKHEENEAASSGSSESDTDPEITKAFAQYQLRPTASDPPSCPATPADWEPRTWSSPVDDTQDEAERLQRQGPHHPLPEKVSRDARFPTRTWSVAMPTRQYPLPTVLCALPSGNGSGTHSLGRTGGVGGMAKAPTSRSAHPSIKMGGEDEEWHDILYDNDDVGFRPVEPCARKPRISRHKRRAPDVPDIVSEQIDHTEPRS